MPTDILITYCEEQFLYPEFEYWMNFETQNGIQNSANRQAFGQERTRNWYNLHYWFRAVEQNCPWVHKIIFIIANEKHIPAWLKTNHPKLEIVFHKDFIPSELLPTYNINVIETFEHKIKQLSNNFIYCDDDFFFLRPISDTKFFDIDGLPQSCLNTTHWHDYSTVSSCGDEAYYFNLNNTHKFCAEHYGFPGDLWFGVSHLPEPRVKQHEEMVYFKYENWLYNSIKISKFRHKDNMLNGFLYINTLKFELLKAHSNLNLDLYQNSLFQNINQNTNFNIYYNKEMACFNDSPGCTDFITARKNLTTFLQSKFPNKSSFEK